MAAAPKFGAPLYGAAWPAGGHVLVAGGGGKASSGIPNRIVAVPLDATHPAGLAPAAASLPVDATPLRLALAPDGSGAALALAGGGVARVDLTASPGGGASLTLRSGSRSASTDGERDGSGDGGKKDGPSLSPGSVGHAAVGAVAAAVGVIPRVLFRTRSGKDVPGGAAEVKALAFSADARALAAAGEDGVLRIYAWPSLKPTVELAIGGTASGGGLRDVDWAGDDAVAVALEDGSAAVWSVPRRAALARLPPPAKPAGASIARVRFDARAGVRRLVAAVNARGAGWLAAANADAATPPSYSWSNPVRILPAPITAFAASPCGRFLGAGSADGGVALARAADLAPAGGAPRGHMVFVTAAAFERVTVEPGNEGAAPPARLLTVSADASARVTTPRRRRAAAAVALLALLLAALAALLLLLAAREPACRRGARACGAAAAARAGGAADGVLEAVRLAAVAAGIVGRFPGGDRGEL